MKTKFIFLRGLKFLVFGTAAISLVGWATMGLWNWLIPVLFHGPVICFWQALGLLVLSRILVGGFGHRCGGWGGGRWGEKRRAWWREKMEERLSHMSPEEKERFKQQMKERWGNRCGKNNMFDDSSEKERV
jgi:hypothetical protein